MSGIQVIGPEENDFSLPESHRTSIGQRFGKQEFEIQARSCTLLFNAANTDDILWRDATCYRVPVFQRPYTWGETEVRRLLKDLLIAYFGRNGRVRREPMFIGTIQLMAAETVNLHSFRTRHDIIDGQQRLTTLILILRALETMAPTAKIGETSDYRRRLSSTVNGNIQQSYMDEVLNDSHRLENTSKLNIYLRNLLIIKEMLLEDETINDNPGDLGGFANYLYSRVYFVVIETRAQLSKTLQIFDAINTSGMDLNGGDVFKIRYYEYLREKKRAPEEVFEKVCALYETIDQGNRDRTRAVVSMEDVLSLAQQIIITDYGLSIELRSLAGTTFFERLFDVIMGIQPWDNFQKVKCERVELPLEFIEELIDVSFSWEDTIPKLRPEPYAMSWFIWWSRYGRYHYLIRYFLHRFREHSRDSADFRIELEQFIIELSKLLLVQSLCFKKVTKEGRQRVREIMALLSKDKTDTMPADVITHLAQERAAQSTTIRGHLLADRFADIAKAKNIVCRLDAMLHELEFDTESESLEKLLFEGPIDIEHIESHNHKDHNKRARIHETWGDELHQLGNLIILETNLNRSILNDDYATVKRDRYSTKSRFRVVRHFATSNPGWTRELASARRVSLADKLTDYLCGSSLPADASERALTSGSTT